MEVQLWVLIVSVLAAAAVALVIGALIGFIVRKTIGEKKIGSAEKEARRILEDAAKNADARKKEILLEGKEEVLRLRNETERELKERRGEVSRQERRLNQKYNLKCLCTDGTCRSQQNNFFHINIFPLFSTFIANATITSLRNK